MSMSARRHQRNLSRQPRSRVFLPSVAVCTVAGAHAVSARVHAAAVPAQGSHAVVAGAPVTVRLVVVAPGVGVTTTTVGVATTVVVVEHGETVIVVVGLDVIVEVVVIVTVVVVVVVVVTVTVTVVTGSTRIDDEATAGALALDLDLALDLALLPRAHGRAHATVVVRSSDRAVAGLLVGAAAAGQAAVAVAAAARTSEWKRTRRARPPLQQPQVAAAATARAVGRVVVEVLRLQGPVRAANTVGIVGGARTAPAPVVAVGAECKGWDDATCVVHMWCMAPVWWLSGREKRKKKNDMECCQLWPCDVGVLRRQARRTAARH